jgi:ubiquinone/menaquinone biosynthesis C-methylase UbiE
MKNILGEKPTGKLDGRVYEAVRFVPDSAIADKHILDIGCGFGWCAVNFLERGAAYFLGIEITDTDLEAARKYVHSSNAKFEVGSAIDIPSTDQKFDTVVCWEVIEHIPSHTEPKMFEEVARVLKPGGHFYLSTPHAALQANLLDPAWWLIHHRHYSKATLAEFGKKHGLRLTHCEVKAGWWMTIGLLNFYISKWILRRHQLASDLFQRKITEEYARDGFANIFVEYTKI